MTLPHAIHYQRTPEFERTAWTVESAPGVDIAVRRVRGPEAEPGTTPLLMLHGARAPSIPSFDLDVPGGSLAGDIARTGSTVYLMDARNYGGSTRSPAMVRNPAETEPLTRSHEAVEDIRAAVEHVCHEQGVDQIALMGWATGSQWSAHYAATFPHRVSHLILYNSLWPVAGSWPVGDSLEDPENPGYLRRDALPAYGLATRDALLARWNSSIPADDLDEWRDPLVADAYASTAIASDPGAPNEPEPLLRTPLGAMADSFLLSRGHRLFDPCEILASVLVIRSELDFWSRSIDVEGAMASLESAKSLRQISLAGATHFAHLDRPARGRDRLIELVTREIQ